MKTKTQSGKRILEVKIIRAADTDPDTSYLGEYSNQPAPQYAIDRAHALDCPFQEHNHREAFDKLKRVISYLSKLQDELTQFTDPNSSEWEVLNDAISTIVQAQEDVAACDCGGGDRERGQYQYFNPNVANYKGEKPEDVRKYARQDYERMEAYNNQQWCYIGIRAVAKVQTALGAPIQTLSSGGLWGIESDSDSSYFDSVAGEELSQLKGELKALGFSARAISSAFKNVKEVES
jgi:hypothetical protein